VHSVSGVREWILVLMLFFYGSILCAQENIKEHEKKNPDTRNLEIGMQRSDSSHSIQKTDQRQLPEFELPEYVITGIVAVDLPKVDKISSEDVPYMPQKTIKSFGKDQRNRKTTEFGTKRLDYFLGGWNTYAGMVQAGIGSFFTPRAGVWFGQSLTNFRYTLGGTYRLTKGFKDNTDQSEGTFGAEGSTSLISDVSLLQNAVTDAAFNYRSESFRFYGSTTPHLQRTMSGWNLKAGIENQASNSLPYVARISFKNMNIADSSASGIESSVDLNLQTSVPVSFLPIQLEFHGMAASNGIGFMDASVGFQNYRYAGIMFNGSLHMYWAKGMAGQNVFRVRPHAMVKYLLTTQHSVYIAYAPMIIPMTLASNIQLNRFLSADSKVKHANVTNAGELGLESEWNETIRSRVSFGLKTIGDWTMFSDSSRKGVWTTGYGGEATIVTFSAEMVAKFMSNDYFASNIMLRSTKDSFLGKRIPYVPEIEAGFRISHRFGATIEVTADVRVVGKQQADFTEKSTVSSYAVADVSGDYNPLDFLKFSIGIKNLTNVRYELWRGYQESPLAIQLAVQVKW
jgi:hypothetical protein